MTFEHLLEGLESNKISTKDARSEVMDKNKLRVINFYVHKNDVDQEPLTDSQLQELGAIVGVLQILYNSDVDSPINDSSYDILQEMLINMGIPRLTGTVEINDNSKVSHTFTNLRGTLDKVYYLFPNETRTNKSRKYLDEWIKSTEVLYKKNTGKDIDLNKVKIILQCKFDGGSVIMEDGPKPLWITRGDTKNNRASDVSHVMSRFNNEFSSGRYGGVKFEVMVPEESKDKINAICKLHPFHNSRQIVTAALNSNEVDFKADYLYPVPLREIHGNEEVEHIHPMMLSKFPTQICTFGDRNTIKQFADQHRYVNIDGVRLRTDGVVLTILDDELKIALGRDNDINNFEVAYKFTEECAYTRVKDIVFKMGMFGTVTPVLIVNEVILKGNTISQITLSNKERFDELGLCYGDEVKVLYDIIPYVTIDKNCRRVLNGRKIEFVTKCPRCNENLDLNHTIVQCTNPTCPSRVIGNIKNYCVNLRIKNIGYRTIEALYDNGLLDHGIVSLYELRRKQDKIRDIEGFGKLKTRKMISEIEAKRRLDDFQFFGSIGIQNASMKTFEMIFDKIELQSFLDMLKLKNFDLMEARLITVKGVGDITAKAIVDSFSNPKRYDTVKKLLSHVKLRSTYKRSELPSKGTIVFTGCRPSDKMEYTLKSNGWKISENWTNKASMLVVPSKGYTSAKVGNAKDASVDIITIDNVIEEAKRRG